MHLRQSFLNIPVSLVLLVLAEANGEHNPRYEQPPSQPRLPPLTVRKMGLDEGEKFYPEQYYAFVPPNNEKGVCPSGRQRPSFAHNVSSEPRRYRLVETRDAPGVNHSATAFLPPFAVHNDDETHTTAWEIFRRAADALTRLQRRQWDCPGGTSSCAGIGYPYSCCSSGETCYQVTDTGLGSVGCCPRGLACTGDVLTCGSGNMACPASLGGGCCIVGYVCQGVGCVRSSTIATTTTTTKTSTTMGQPSTTTVTVVVTTGAGGVTTRTTTLTTTSPAGVAPVKPTQATTTASSDSSSTPTLSLGSCPTGYYACAASAGGGCCQTGRDCHTTSCPPALATTTVVDANGATLVVPAVGTAPATVTPASTASTCATGWFLCPSNAGPIAGCCPTGYTCGTASCTLMSATATGEVQKELLTSSDGGRRRGGYGRGMLAWLVAVCLVAVV